MKVLLLCLRVPWPLTDGGNLAMMNMAEMLRDAGHDVTIFALNTKKHFVSTEDIPEKIFKGIRLVSTPIDTGIRVNKALRNLFRPNESYNVARFHDSTAAARLKELVQKEKFDIVQFESLFTTTYLPIVRANSSARVVLRAHNVEHIIWERLSREAGNQLRKSYLKFLAKRMKKYESAVVKEMDGILPISPLDEPFFLDNAPKNSVCTIPMGIDLNAYSLQTNASLQLFHLGAMDWLPNQEGIKWFLDTCWPLIHVQHSELQLHLAGRGFPAALIDNSIPMVSFTGAVKDAQEFMQDKQIMIVPLHSGSGLRIKILQGLALGKTIIATSVGAEGIDVTDGKNILIANTPEEFEQKVTYCIADEARCKSIGLAGRKLIEEKYSGTVLGGKVADYYRQLLL